MRQDPDGAYYGRHCSASKGKQARRLYIKAILTITQEMGGAEGKVAYIGGLLVNSKIF